MDGDNFRFNISADKYLGKDDMVTKHTPKLIVYKTEKKEHLQKHLSKSFQDKSSDLRLWQIIYQKASERCNTKTWAKGHRIDVDEKLPSLIFWNINKRRDRSENITGGGGFCQSSEGGAQI